MLLPEKERHGSIRFRALTIKIIIADLLESVNSGMSFDGGNLCFIQVQFV